MKKEIRISPVSFENITKEEMEVRIKKTKPMKGLYNKGRGVNYKDLVKTKK